MNFDLVGKGERFMSKCAIVIGRGNVACRWARVASMVRTYEQVRCRQGIDRQLDLILGPSNREAGTLESSRAMSRYSKKSQVRPSNRGAAPWRPASHVAEPPGKQRWIRPLHLHLDRKDARYSPLCRSHRVQELQTAAPWR